MLSRIAMGGLLPVLGGTAVLVAGAPVKTPDARTSSGGKSGAPRKTSPAGAKRAPDPGVKMSALRFYRRWTVANKQPVFVPSSLAILCAPAPMSSASTTPPSPHEGKYIRVYVNSIGRQALLHKKTPRFPVGSIIVKEKLAAPQSRTPELLTVMVKRAGGFDSKNGDWEYLVTNGAGTKVQQHGKLSNCQNCHVPQKEAGYVFRTYLPDAVRRALR